MKIALIITARGELGERQLGEISYFINQSALVDPEFEIWRLAGTAPWFAENNLVALETHFLTAPQDLLLFPSGLRGTELATRLASRLQGQAFCGATKMVSTEQITFSRPVYGNAMVGCFSAGEKPWCVGVSRSSRPGVFPAAATQKTLQLSNDLPPWLLEINRLEDIPHPALQRARCVLAVGQGVETLQNMERVKVLAQKLGAETGASRQVVMNAWCEMDRLIGMSGAMISPDVCIVAGVSGAAAFSAGIRDSTLIVAINNDENAAIFSQADVVIVDEMMPVLEALAEYSTQ